MAKRKYDDYLMENPMDFEETEKSSAEVKTTGPETINGVIVNSLFVKVRKEPNFESETVETLNKGMKVKILEKGKDFWKVSTSLNDVAYIASDFIEEDRDGKY